MKRLLHHGEADDGLSHICIRKNRYHKPTMHCALVIYPHVADRPLLPNRTFSKVTLKLFPIVSKNLLITFTSIRYCVTIASWPTKQGSSAIWVCSTGSQTGHRPSLLLYP